MGTAATRSARTRGEGSTMRSCGPSWAATAQKCDEKHSAARFREASWHLDTRIRTIARLECNQQNLQVTAGLVQNSLETIFLASEHSAVCTPVVQRMIPVLVSKAASPRQVNLGKRLLPRDLNIPGFSVHRGVPFSDGKTSRLRRCSSRALSLGTMTCGIPRRLLNIPPHLLHYKFLLAYEVTLWNAKRGLIETVPMVS